MRGCRAAAASTISGLYNLIPDKVGQVDELAQIASNFGEQTENWQGVDVSVTARLRNGLTVQGGTSTGRRLSDACAMKAVLPELGTGSYRREHLDRRRLRPRTNPYCRVSSRTDADPGARDVYDPQGGRPGERHVVEQRRGELAANYVVTNAVIAAGPQPLGRNLSAAPTSRST